MRRTEYSFPADQYAEAKVTFTTGAEAAGTRPAVRCDINGNCYNAKLDTNLLTLFKVTGGNGSGLGTDGYLTESGVGVVTASAGNEYLVRISVSGTTVKGFVDGVEVASVTDSSLASGKPGVILTGNADQPTLDDFACTDATTTVPNFPWIVGAGQLTATTTALTPNKPTINADDIWLCVVETANQSLSLTTSNNFAQITNSPQGTGTAGGTTATLLAVYYVRATGSQASPVFADPGDHTIGRIIVVRGCIASGNPVNISAGDVASSASTSVTIPGATTTADNCLVLAIVSSVTDTATSQASGWTNSNLASLVEEIDNWNTTGNGGGFAIASGVKAIAGSYGSTTATLATSSVQGRISLALTPGDTYPAAHAESLGFSYNPLLRM